MQFREGIISDYPSLFGGGDEEGTGYSAAENFGAKWGWYQSIYTLAGGDALKFDEATSLPLHQALTYLTFEKEKLQLEAKQIKSKF